MYGRNIQIWKIIVLCKEYVKYAVKVESHLAVLGTNFHHVVVWLEGCNENLRYKLEGYEKVNKKS